MHIATFTFDGYNELDHLIALGILNRLCREDLLISIACPGPKVCSMNGITISATATLEEACTADAVIIDILGRARSSRTPKSWAFCTLWTLSAISSPRSAPAL